MAAIGQPTEQQFLSQRALDVLLDRARHRARTHLRVVAALGDPAARRIVEGEGDALGLQLRLHFHDDLVDHALDGRALQRAELDDRIQTIAELGREDAADRLHAITGVVSVREANRGARHVQTAPPLQRHRRPGPADRLSW